jgi:hypothetical protein
MLSKNIMRGYSLCSGLLTLLDLKYNKYTFDYPKLGWKRIFFIVGMLLMCVYPLVGFIHGKPMTQWIIQGTLPCPTTAYFLILIITASKRDGLLLYGLLLFWAIPFPPLVQIPMYGVCEDGIMFGIGLVGLGMLIKNLVDRQHKTVSLKRCR